MKSFAILLLSLVVSLLVSLPAWADVVHLRHGRTLRGTIVKQTQDAIVLRTPQGEIRVQRKNIARIEEESDADLYLGQARDAVRDQDYGIARQRFKLVLRELKPSDPLRAKVEAELAAVKRRSDPYLRSSPKVNKWTTSGSDPFKREEKEARIREMMVGAQSRADLRGQLIQLLYSRARGSFESKDYLSAAIDFGRAADYAVGTDQQSLRGYEYDSRLRVAASAVRVGDAQLAAVASVPVVNAQQGDRNFLRGAYLLGRAEELRQNRGAARTAYLQALEGLAVEEAKLPLLRELARLRAAGSNVNADTAGVGPRWKWVQTSHFGIVHELGTSNAELTRTLEAAFRDVVKRLRLGNTSGEQIAVFLFADRDRYQRSSGALGWSRAHASRLQGQDELILSIYAYPGEGFESTLRHEITHILMWRELGDAVFPTWAGEGIAQYAEGEEERASNRRMVQILAARGELPAWEGELARMLYPIQQSQVALTAFYAQGGVMFEVLAERMGPKKAMRLLTRFNEEDPQTVLRGAGVDPGGFFAELNRISSGR